MTKKIKDLTISECINYCNINRKHKRYCYNCPLSVTENVNPTCIRNALHSKFDIILEREVEIDG